MQFFSSLKNILILCAYFFWAFFFFLVLVKTRRWAENKREHIGQLERVVTSF